MLALTNKVSIVAQSQINAIRYRNIQIATELKGADIYLPDQDLDNCPVKGVDEMAMYTSAARRVL